MSRFLPASFLIAIISAACASSPAPATNTPTTTEAPAAPTTAPALQPIDGELAALVIRLSVDDLETRARAARDLGAMGADAVPALPELIVCAAAEPAEPGGRDLEVDPGHLGELEPSAECAAAIAAIAADAPESLVAALAVPLDLKERALAALLDVGPVAIPGAAAVYLDACERRAAASDAVVERHLRVTADAALAVLATSPTRATGALDGGDTCARDGLERVRTLAARP